MARSFRCSCSTNISSAPEAARRTPFRMQFLLESLASLAANLEHLGSRLILVDGRSVEQVPRLAERWKVDRVVAQSWVAPIGRERDREIAQGAARPARSCSTPKRCARPARCAPAPAIPSRCSPRSRAPSRATSRVRAALPAPRALPPAARGRAHAQRRAAHARVVGPHAQSARAGRRRAPRARTAQGLAGARCEGLRRAAQSHGPARHQPPLGGPEIRHAVGAHGVERGRSRACASCRPMRCASTRTNCCGASSRTPRSSTGRSC